MERILIFGGTTEGRELARKYALRGDAVTVCVTSEYARALLGEDIPCHVGAMDGGQMAAFMEALCPDRVIDATHPFAVRATQTIRDCARRLGLPLERVAREQTRADWRDAVQWAADADDAADMLAAAPGNVLLTTGSHTLSRYARSVDAARLYVRVLPTHQALEACGQAGILPSHIVAMQGPFTAELNAAIYDQLGIRVMVTKDSGASGGIDEKVIPALKRDIHVIVIKRPEEKTDTGGSACGENR